MGVDDNGSAIGISRSYEEDIMNVCRIAVIPSLRPEYEDIPIENGKYQQIACIKISKGVDRPYYTSRNKYYIRVGTTKRIASQEATKLGRTLDFENDGEMFKVVLGL